MKRPLGADLVIPALALGFALYFFWSIADLAWEAKANGVVIGAALIVLVVVQVARIALAVAQGRADLRTDILWQPRDVLAKRIGMVAVTIAFILLLQVLGEDRLTDALGRTVDFGNALIVLTSNLGVRESEGTLGFRQDDAATDALFVQAAERFFRPEFFNRLDRVLPFRRLTRMRPSRGIMSPFGPRTLSLPMSFSWARASGSAWTFTCHVRCSSVTSFTYTDPR